MENKIMDILVDLKDNIDDVSGNDVLDIIVKKLNETPMEIAQNKLSDSIYDLMLFLMDVKNGDVRSDMVYDMLKESSEDIVKYWLNIKELDEINRIRYHRRRK